MRKVENKGVDRKSSLGSVTELFKKGDVEAINSWVEIFFRTLFGPSIAKDGKWDISGCRVFIKHRNLVVEGINLKQSACLPGRPALSILQLCVAAGLCPRYVICSETLSIQIPARRFDDIVNHSVLVLFDEEGRMVLTDEEMRVIDDSEECVEAVSDIGAGEVSSRVASVLDGEAGNVSFEGKRWEEGCRKVGINPDFDPGFIF